MAAPTKRRIAYIDWMRGFACLLMFQTHCYDAWLGGTARRTEFFRWSQLGGTLPAPLFLLLAGVSVALATDRHWQQGIAAGRIARTTMLRGVEVFGFGILFRMQEFLLGQPKAPWTDLLRVDILNIIGLSIVLLGALIGAASWLVSMGAPSLPDQRDKKQDKSAGNAPEFPAPSTCATSRRGYAGRLRHRAGDSAPVDHLASAVAAVVPRVLRQWRAHL